MDLTFKRVSKHIFAFFSKRLKNQKSLLKTAKRGPRDGSFLRRVKKPILQTMITAMVFQSFVPVIQAGCRYSKEERAEEESAATTGDLFLTEQRISHSFDEGTLVQGEASGGMSLQEARDFLIEKTLEPLLEGYLKSLPRSKEKRQVFISYAWPKKEEEREIQPFLLKLASHMKRVGLSSIMDLMDLDPGSNITAFMEEGIRNSHAALIIGSETYYTRSTEETPVRYEFERVLKEAGKGLFVRYRGDVPGAFKEQLDKGGIQHQYDMRTPEGYYQTVPLLLGQLLQKDLQKSLSSYTSALEEQVRFITDEEVRRTQEQLKHEARNKKRAMALQVEVMVKSLPEDERFNPQDWHVPASSPLFTGRKKELETLVSQLVPGETHQIRITGSKGIGKKELAYAYAKETKKLYDGAFSVQSLEELAKVLKVTGADQVFDRLKRKKQLLFIVTEKTDSALLKVIRKLPIPTHIIGLGKKSLSKGKSLPLRSLTHEEAQSLLEQGSSDLDHSKEWSHLAERFKDHPGALTKVLQYYQENRIIDASDMLSAFKSEAFDQVFSAWEPKKPAQRQQDALTRSMLRRQGTLRKTAERITTLLEGSYYLKQRLLQPLIQSYLGELKDRGSSNPSVYLALLPEAQERHLLIYDQLVQDLTALGLSPRYLLNESEEQDSLYPIRGLEENSYVFVLGTPVLEGPQREIYTQQFQEKQESNHLFLLTVDNNYGQFSDYSTQGQFISSVSSPESYAETLLRSVAEMLLMGEEKKTFRQKYEQQIKDEAQKVTEQMAREQGRSLKDRGDKEIWQKVKEIREQAFLHEYALKPFLWTLTQEEETVGRQEILTSLSEALKFPESTQVVLSGLGGMGKSHLARQYATDHQSWYMYGFALNGADTSTLYNDYVTLGQKLGLTLPSEAEKVFALMKQTLAQPENQGWLIIVDNADNPGSIKDHLPTQGGHLLITSRSDGWEGVPLVDLPPMNREASVELLGVRSGLVTDRESAGRVAELLGDHPLALIQAGAYIQENALQKYQVYEELYKKTPAMKSAIGGTWQVTLQKIQEENPRAIELLEGISFLAPDALPNAFLRTWLREKWQLKEDWKINHEVGLAMGSLARYSMMKASRTETTTHRLVQQALREGQRIDQKKAYLKGLVPALHAETHDKWKETDVNSWAWVKQMAPHAKEGVTHGEEFLEKGHQLVCIAQTIACSADKEGKYQENLEWTERALKIAEKTYGPEDANMGYLLVNMGIAYQYLGRYEEALEAQEKALKIEEKSLGSDHPEVAITLVNMGNAYQDLGRCEEALEAQEKALKIQEKTYGPDHPSVALTLVNIGIAYRALGRYEEALEAQEKALKIKEKSLGPDHPEVARTLGNMGLAYEDLGRYEEALEAQEKALKIKEKSLGPDHPHVGKAIADVGDAYYKLKRIDQAEENTRKGIRIMKKTYRESHPWVKWYEGNLERIEKEKQGRR